jgi:peptidoglycan/LPS O-acetylase OafA/YrhL
MANEVRPLTGLRGVAAIYVVTYHFGQDVQGGGPFGTVLRHGYLAVDLFFVLSGFVLAMVHGRDRFDGAGIRRFLGKRFARVYPLYAAMTAVTAGIAAASGVTLSPGHVLVNVLLVQAWGVGASIVGPAWSLSAEAGAYLLFPLLCAALLRGSREQAVALTCAALALLGFVALHSTIPRAGPLDLYQSNTVAPLVRCLCEFALGLVAYRFSRSASAQRVATHGVDLVLAGAVAALLTVRGCDLVLVPLLAVLVVALAVRPDGPVGRALSTAPVMWLGTVSFSVYLTHFLLRDELRPVLADGLAEMGMSDPYAAAGGLTFAIVLLTAQLTFRFIECPARVWLRDRSWSVAVPS